MNVWDLLKMLSYHVTLFLKVWSVCSSWLTIQYKLPLFIPLLFRKQQKVTAFLSVCLQLKSRTTEGRHHWTSRSHPSPTLTLTQSPLPARQTCHSITAKTAHCRCLGASKEFLNYKYIYINIPCLYSSNPLHLHPLPYSSASPQFSPWLMSFFFSYWIY